MISILYFSKNSRWHFWGKFLQNLSIEFLASKIPINGATFEQVQLFKNCTYNFHGKKLFLGSSHVHWKSRKKCTYDFILNIFNHSFPQHILVSNNSKKNVFICSDALVINLIYSTMTEKSKEKSDSCPLITNTLSNSETRQVPGTQRSLCSLVNKR